MQREIWGILVCQRTTALCYAKGHLTSVEQFLAYFELIACRHADSFLGDENISQPKDISSTRRIQNLRLSF